MPQRWSLSQEYSGHIDCDANDQTQGRHSNAPAILQQQRAARQENVLCPFLTGSDGLSCTSFVQTPILNATHPWRAEERNDMNLEHHNPSSQYLTDFDFQGQFPFPFSGNESPQAGNFVWPFNGAADFNLLTPRPITDSSPQSPVEPYAAGHLSSQDFQFPFCGNEYSQPGNTSWPLLIPPSTAAGPPTSSTTTTSPSAQSPMVPSAVAPYATAEDALRTVGSPQIQKAAARRRKKGGIYQCALGNCNSTFTELHNLQYHINSHLHLKPYECPECSYAAASPATLKRHMKRHQ